MSRPVSVRPGGISVTGLTDEIIKRLAEPYDLVLAWTAYLDLEAVLGLNFWDVSACEDLDDGRVLVHFTREFRQKHAVRPVLVPLNLHRKTTDYKWRHLDFDFGVRRSKKGSEMDRLFVTSIDFRAIDKVDVFEAVLSASMFKPGYET